MSATGAKIAPIGELASSCGWNIREIALLKDESGHPTVAGSYWRRACCTMCCISKPASALPLTLSATKLSRSEIQTLRHRSRRAL